MLSRHQIQSHLFKDRSPGIIYYLLWAYHQICNSDEDIHKTVLVTSFGFDGFTIISARNVSDIYWLDISRLAFDIRLYRWHEKTNDWISFRLILFYYFTRITRHLKKTGKQNGLIATTIKMGAIFRMWIIITSRPRYSDWCGEITDSWSNKLQILKGRRESVSNERQWLKQQRWGYLSDECVFFSGSENLPFLDRAASTTFSQNL